MATARTRTSLGRTTLNFDLGLPPSPDHQSNYQGSSIPSLGDLMRRGTPRSQTTNFASQTIPSLSDEEIMDQQNLSSVPDLIRSRSLDEELTRTGYTPLSKMIVVGPKGDSDVRFIKAQNQLGEPLYISVDVNDAFVSHSENDPLLRETRIPMNIPREEKETAFSKAGMGVVGVAMECKNGLCTIMHDDQMNAPREQNFVLVHTKKTKETLVLASFPVVKMSEIRSNPHAVQKNVDCALRKMRNASLDNCICRIKEVEKKFDQTCHLFKETLAAKSKVIMQFKRTMIFLEDNYDKCMCMKCPDQEKLQAIVYNMEKRNSKFPVLMESCKEIASLEQTLDEALVTLKEAKCKLEKKFKHLHCVYELKNKKGQNHKCAWEDHGDTDSEIEYM